MADYGTYNFPDIRSGDILFEIDFSFDAHHASPISKVEFITDYSGYVLSSDDPSQVVIDDATNWQFHIPQQVITWVAGSYKIRMSITCVDGFKHTYTYGAWNIS